MNTKDSSPVLWFQRLTLVRRVQYHCAAMRTALAIVGLMCGTTSWSATLEKLSLDEMSQRSTVIVRSKVNSCAGEQRGSVIYTRCRVSVIERWKGTAGAQLEFLVPGGTSRGLTQVFTGTPNFAAGSEYVLFLWSGRSGNSCQGNARLSSSISGGRSCWMMFQRMSKSTAS